jgi:hypothetical protein
MKQVLAFGVILFVCGSAALLLSNLSVPQRALMAQSDVVLYDENGNPETFTETYPGSITENPSDYYVAGDYQPVDYSTYQYPDDSYYSWDYPSYDSTYTYYTTPSAPYYVQMLPGVGNIAQPIVQGVAPQTAARPAPTCAMAASPNSVAYGGSSVIQWASQNTQWADLTDLGIVDTSGSWQFDGLKVSKTYTLNLSGPGGTGTCSTYVSVGAPPQQQPQTPILTPTSPAQQQVSTIQYVYQTPNYYYAYGYPYYQNYNYQYSYQYQVPTCSVTASPSSVYQGGSVDLTWSSTNATQGTLTDVGVVGASGFKRVTPSVSHPVVFAVSNQYGTNSCSTYVSVNSAPTPVEPVLPEEPVAPQAPRPTCTLNVDPSAIAAGSGATLTWTSKNASTASIDGLGAVDISGSTTVAPSGTATYTLHVQGDGGTRVCTASVTVVPCPQGCANPAPQPVQQQGGFWQWLMSLF